MQGKKEWNYRNETQYVFHPVKRGESSGWSVSLYLVVCVVERPVRVARSRVLGAKELLSASREAAAESAILPPATYHPRSLLAFLIKGYIWKGIIILCQGKILLYHFLSLPFHPYPPFPYNHMPYLLHPILPISALTLTSTFHLLPLTVPWPCWPLNPHPAPPPSEYM